MDFNGFISALYNDWISTMSGIASILFTAMGFIKHKKFDFFKSPGVQRKIFWAMALLCFFFASVSVWTNEHRRALNLLAQLEKERNNNRPNLRIEVFEVFYAKQANKNIMEIFINMAIKNLGSPSIAGGFQLGIKSLFNKRINPIDINERFLKNKKGQIVAHFRPNNSLPEKLIDPLPQGGGKAGWIRFIINYGDIKPEQIFKADKTIYIKDIFDREYSLTITSNTHKPALPGETHVVGSGDQPFIIPKQN